MSEKQEMIEHSDGETFTCIACKFMCKYKSEYERHLTTDKHIRVTHSNALFKKQADALMPYSCICGKVYSSRSSLWYHKKRCPGHGDILSEKVNRVLPQSQTSSIPDPNDSGMAAIIQEMVSIQVKEHIEKMGDQNIYTLIKAQTKRDEAQTDRDEMRDAAQAVRDEAAAEQMRLLIEAISLKGPQCITNNNNNTTNNTQFNLNVFLNEDCKDAFTFKDVIESIVCTVDDLDRLIVEGYAATVIRKILESMQDMAITERPIHCTDLRRNTVCVKSATGWEKGAAALKRLNNSLYFIGKKLGNVVPEWRETYPDHFRGTDSRRNQYHTLIVEVLKVDDVKLEDRNVGIICKSLVLDRKTAKAGIM